MKQMRKVVYVNWCNQCHHCRKFDTNDGADHIFSCIHKERKTPVTLSSSMNNSPLNKHITIPSDCPLDNSTSTRVNAVKEIVILTPVYHCDVCKFFTIYNNDLRICIHNKRVSPAVLVTRVKSFFLKKEVTSIPSDCPLGEFDVWPPVYKNIVEPEKKGDNNE